MVALVNLTLNHEGSAYVDPENFHRQGLAVQVQAQKVSKFLIVFEQGAPWFYFALDQHVLGPVFCPEGTLFIPVEARGSQEDSWALDIHLTHWPACSGPGQPFGMCGAVLVSACSGSGAWLC